MAALPRRPEVTVTASSITSLVGIDSMTVYKHRNLRTTRIERRTVASIPPAYRGRDDFTVMCSRGSELAAWRRCNRIELLCRRRGVNRDAPIGWVARNRPTAIAAFAQSGDAWQDGGSITAETRLLQHSAEELSRHRNFRPSLGDAEDWADAGVIDAAAQSGTLGICIAGLDQRDITLVPSLTRVGPGPHRAPMPGYVLERLTSGTTGSPKRIPVLESVLVPSLQSGEQNAVKQNRGNCGSNHRRRFC